MNNRHIAYNTITGEVVLCTTNSQLRRSVARTNRLNARYGYPTTGWRFCHKGLKGLEVKMRGV